MLLHKRAPLVGALLACLVFASSVFAQTQEVPPPQREIMDTADVISWIIEYSGGQLYPSQVGEPGWPGRHESLIGRRGYEPNVKTGFPEMIPYPGSVEHVRYYMDRYIPVYPYYNARTLLRLFPATQLPGIASERIVSYAEPIYHVPKYLYPNVEEGRFSDAHKLDFYNDPIDVVRFDATHPPIELDLGELAPGPYVLRLIAATDERHVQMSTLRLVIKFQVNDGPNGAWNTYGKRTAALSEFYSIVEFFFMAPEKRDYKARVWIDPSSRMPLYLHSIDLHDRLGEVANVAAKRTAMLYDEEDRARQWAERGGPAHDARTQEERFQADLEIWQALPPLNSQGLNSHASIQGALHGAVYRLPGDVEDDGYGIDLYGSDMIWNIPEDQYQTLAGDQRRLHFFRNAVNWGQRWNLQRQTHYEVAREYTQQIGAILRAQGLEDRVKAYHEQGDEQTAREAALMLARIGWLTMFNIYDNRQQMATIDAVPELGVSNLGDMAFRRRKPIGFGAYQHNFGANADQYDTLFPYIRGNQDLADSLGRFIPWIKTSEDVQRFYEVTLLQLPAHEIMTFQRYSGLGTGKMMTHLINAQQDEAVAKPWIHWLFRYLYTYPNMPTGVDETLFSSWTRDGTTLIGSTYYTLGTTDVISTIMANMLPFATGLHGAIVQRLRLPEIYSRLQWETEFRKSVMVASGYAFWIGNVSGPTRPRWSVLRSNDPQVDPHNPSRVLANWFGILETNVADEDFRNRRAAGLRVGKGLGHAHTDPLDLQIWAHGVPLSGDWGGRGGYCYPGSASLVAHNTLVAPEILPLASSRYSAETVHGLPPYISSFADLPAARYLAGQVKVDGIYGRQLALIDDDDAANSYVVDVFRIRGVSDMPAYAFHGPPPDEFYTNIDALHKGWPEGMEEPEFDLETNWHGEISDHFMATWRMGRDERIIELHPSAEARKDVLSPHYRTYEEDGKILFPVIGGERQAMGRDFQETDPRRYIRMHMLGRGGATAYGRRGFGLTRDLRFYNDMVFVYPEKWQGEADQWSGEAVFPVVYEPYAGESWIRRIRLLSDRATLGNADAAVAMEITLRSGRRDIVFIGMESDDVFALPDGGSIQGEFALLSYDSEGLRQATLVGGTRLESQDVTITSPFAAYEGVVVDADPRIKMLQLSVPLPPEAVGDVIRTGPLARPTSYTIESVDGAKVTTLKDFALMMSRVVGFLEEDGMPYTHNKFYMPKGVSLSNDARDTWWLSGEPYDLAPHEKPWPDGGSAHPIELPPRGTAIRLENGPEPAATLAAGERFWAYEVGVGNPYRYPVQINVRREADGGYRAIGNVDASVEIQGKAVVVERGQMPGWQPQRSEELQTLIDQWKAVN